MALWCFWRSMKRYIRGRVERLLRLFFRLSTPSFRQSLNARTPLSMSRPLARAPGCPLRTCVEHTLLPVSQIVTRLRSSRSARHERELRSSLSALGRCSLEGLQSTLAVPVLDGTLVVPVPDSTVIGRAMCEDCHSSIGLTASSGRRCRRSFLCTVCG